MLGLVPHPADTDPELNHQEFQSTGVKIKVRPGNFESTLQLLRTLLPSNGLLHFYMYEKGFLLMSPLGPDSVLFLQKGLIVLLHSSKGLSSCPPRIPDPHYFRWAWNCWKWTMAANFFSFISKGAFNGVIKVWTFYPCDEGKQGAQLSGMASVLLWTKCWDVDLFQEGGPLPGPETGLLANAWEWIVWGDTCTDKARDFIGKGWRAVGLFAESHWLKPPTLARHHS